MMDITKPTTNQANAYTAAFDELNNELFDGSLSQPMLVLTRNSNIIGGHFLYNKWRNEDGKLISEIAINSNVLDCADINKIMGILIHEMIHYKQHEEKTSGRKGYHNKGFAKICKSVGLRPRNADGGETGQSVSTKVIPGGKAHKVISNMSDEAIFPWLAFDCGSPDPQGSSSGGGPSAEESKSGKRSKYTCAVCGLNAWAKPNVKIDCHTCDKVLVEMKK